MRAVWTVCCAALVICSISVLTAATARFRNVPGPYTTCAGRAFISLPHGLFHPPYGVADPAGAGVNASSCWFATSTWPARHASSWLTVARSLVSTRSVSGSRIRITTGSPPKCWLSSRLAWNVGDDRLTNVSLFVFGVKPQRQRPTAQRKREHDAESHGRFTRGRPREPPQRLAPSSRR